jgi:hypothetical protein
MIPKEKRPAEAKPTQETERNAQGTKPVQNTLCFQNAA